MDKDIKTSKIEWEAEEFDSYDRDARWYLGAGIVLMLALVYTIYIKQWILTAVALMVGVVLFLSGRIKSQKRRCVIDNNGIEIGDKQFNYDKLKTFWFSKSNGVIKLNLITVFRLMPVISIHITRELESKIREVLVNFLPESKNQKEDWIDRINKILRV